MPQGDKDVEAELKKGMKNVLVATDVLSAIPINWWSSLSKGYRILAWVCQFINRVRKKVQATEDLKQDELVEVRKVFVRSVQITHFHNEVSLLKEGKALPKTPSWKD